MLNCLFEGGSRNILCATNGKDAIEIARKELPDMILMDWDMPDITGIDAIGSLNAGEETKDIPVIIATGAMLENTDLDFSLASGAMDYIRKPYDKLELLARIRTTLEYTDLLHASENQKRELSIEKERLEKNLERLQTMVDASQDALVFLQGDTIRDVSGRFVAFTGYVADELIGQTLSSLVPTKDRSALLTLEIGEIECTHLSLMTLDGGYLPCQARINSNSCIGDSYNVISIQKTDKICEDEQGRQLDPMIHGRDEVQLITEINNLKSEIEGLNRQLGSNLLREFQMNEFVNKLSRKLNELKESRDFANDRCYKALHELIQEISMIQNHKLWDEFRMRFNEIHPDFYRRLLKDYPSLTETDLRIMAFIKLNLSTKEISEITIQPVNTIKAIRKRIRQKLQLKDRSVSLLAVMARY